MLIAPTQFYEAEPGLEQRVANEDHVKEVYDSDCAMGHRRRG